MGTSHPAWGLHSGVYLGAYAVNVNANSVADTTMNVRLPPSAQYSIDKIVIQNLGTTGVSYYWHSLASSQVQVQQVRLSSQLVLIRCLP